ncbi:MAG: NAD-dependent epimerase/dehydratase family protein [Nitrosopumilaceae archaeon]
MKILVTGASGFIGNKLATRLAEKGHSVIGLVNKNKIQNSNFKTISGDLTKDDFSLPNEKFDVVFHLAAVTPMEKNKKIIKNVNFQGVVNLFNQINGKTDFLVYVSGLGVFGEPGDAIIDEKSALKPHTNYAKIRLDAQRYLEKKCKENSIHFSVAYLGEVYGDGGWFTSQIVSRLRKGSFRMPKSGEYYRCLVHVDDAVNSLIAIFENKAYDESFIITDSNPVLFRDFINYTCDKLGVKHPGSVPTFLAKTVLGGDFVKLLTTSIRASNKKILKFHTLEYPSFKEGIESVISKLK